MAEPQLIKGGVSIDDRGKVSYINDFDFKKVKRFYMVENHKQGFVRAWHGHKKESKYALVVKGSVLLALQPMDSEDIKDSKIYVLSAEKPETLFIPAGYYNGFKTLTDGATIIFFSTTTLDESQDDDFRKPANHWNIWGDQWR